MQKHTGALGKVDIVFLISFALSIALACCAGIGGEAFSDLSSGVMGFLEQNFGWVYLLAMFGFVIFAIVVALSSFGGVRLGAGEDVPEYSTPSWLAMLFCAGMGVGLVFWGVAEPISHYVSPASGTEPMSSQAANFAMNSCFMHWGFHPWAAYAVVGLGLAYAHHRKGRPLLISSLLAPLRGFSQKKALGSAVDVFASIVTVAGVSTSLGLGCLQIAAGLEMRFGIESSPATWFAIVGVICVVYSLSAVAGISRGVRLLSNANAVLALLFAVLCFLVGPTLLDLNIFTTTMGTYLNTFVETSLNAFPFSDDAWLLSWRVFYWAWWIAWSPFVGMFIAKISKGRTVREFVLGVVLVPAALSMVWFSIFGGLGLDFALSASEGELLGLVSSPENALFAVLDAYSIGGILSVVALVIVVVFFITSADSATYVLGVMSTGGDQEPPAALKVFWGIAQALVALALLVAGGIGALQTFSIAAAFPFILIMMLSCVGLVSELRNDLPMGKLGLKSGGVDAGGRPLS